MSFGFVDGYETNFPLLDLSLKKRSGVLFDLLIIDAKLDQFRKGFKVTKVSKTTKKGTSLTCKRFKDVKDKKDYMLELSKEHIRLNTEFKEALANSDFKKEMEVLDKELKERARIINEGRDS